MKRFESGFWAHRDINADDPHLQYLRVDGLRSMIDDLNMDGYDILNLGLVNNVDVEYHASRHQANGQDPLDGYNLTLNYSPINYSVVNDLIGEHISAIDRVLSKKRVTVEFALTEEVNNTVAYFFTWAGSIGGLRSSANTGLQTANNCSPYQVPFDATIKKAILRVYGVGVQNGSVTYPVSYETNLLRVNGTSETKLSDVDFIISNSYTVGTYTVGTTDFTGNTTLNINVDEGQMLGMQFENGSSASVAGQTRMAFITLVLEER